MQNLNKLQRIILYDEVKPITHLLQNIRYAVVKGEVLSQHIYGVPDKRRSSDIDILIDRKNVNLLEELLLTHGFEQMMPSNSIDMRRNRVLCMAYSHQIPSFHKEKYGLHLNVDVNFDIFWGEYEGHRCSMDDFLCDTVDMEIYGTVVKTLTIEKAFVQLILHHYKEMNSLFHLSQRNTIRTHMFTDVLGMVLNNREILTIERVVCLCERYGIGAYVYYMLYYANLVSPNTVFEAYLDQLIEYRKESIMMSFGLSCEERKPWLISFQERLDNKDLPNVLLTPHAAWAAYEARVRCVTTIAANIESYLSGDKLNVVNN